MQLAYIFVVIAAALVQAAPAPDSDAPMVAKAALEGVAPQACLPASCQSFGVSWAIGTPQI